MRRVILAVGAAMLLAVVMAGTALAADFQNGSFEESGYAPDSGAPISFMAVPPGSTVITGWTVDGANGVDWKGRLYWIAADRELSIDLNHISAGSLSQEFDTNVNSTYVITFGFAGNPVEHAIDCPVAEDKTMTVHATGGPTRPYSANTSPWYKPWQPNLVIGWHDEEYSFRAIGGSSTLTFTSTVGGPCGPAIDHVRVHEIPATAADCKKGGWRSMRDARGVAFKNQGDCRSFYTTKGSNVAAGG